jgi:Na+-driven multidrug efflux pump
MPTKKSLFERVVTNPRSTFLVDTIGAITSALSLYCLVLPLQSYFGVPMEVVWKLGGISVLFIGFSLGCYLAGDKKVALKLKIIITGNLLYGIITSLLIYLYRMEITALGIAYFVAEFSVIIALVLLERECLRRYSRSGNK